jgi:flavorubredoxin
VTWHPPEARGFAPMNTYVLIEGDDALIIDTGISIHTDALLDQLAGVLGPSPHLAILHTRIGEYTTISNTVPIAERFPVATIHSEQEDSPRWIDFRNGHGRDVGELDVFADTEIRLFVVPDTIVVDAAASRVLDVFHATLRLLPTSWVYDRRTRTLFTSDVFSHAMRTGAEGPWVLTDADDDTTLEGMRRHLLSTRYWWLAGAHLDDIRASIADTFARHDVETIAPDFGCVLSGRTLVRRHVGMLDAILAEAQELAPAPMAASGTNR